MPSFCSSMRLHPPLSCALAALLFGCLGKNEPGEGVAVVQHELARECESPRDEALILAILTQTVSEEQLDELHCVESEDCPCGTYCDDGFCTADCLSTSDPDYGCSGEEECDLWGRCDVPGAPPDPTRVVIDVTPPAVDVAAVPVGQPYAPIEITVVATALEAPSEAPQVRVRGNHTVRVECPGGGASCEDPTEEVVRELEVQCAEGAPFSDECTLGSWSFNSSGSGVEATQTVQVRPRSDAQESAWQLFFDGDDIVSQQTVSLVRQSVTPQPLDGRYQGSMVISRRGPPTDEESDAGPGLAATPNDLTIRVTAVVEDDHVLLIDPSRLVTPSGKIRLGPTGTSSRVEWLSGDGGALIGTLASEAREHDANAGHLRLRFSMTLPLHDQDQVRSMDMLVDLDRRGPVTAPTCTASNGCAALGQSCDVVLQRCLPGPAFAPSSLPAGNGLASTSLWSWSNAVLPNLTAWGVSPDGMLGDDVIERLQCYDGPASTFDAVLGKTIMTLTGDVRCAQPSEPFPYGLRLLNAVDLNGGVSASQNVAAMLTQCLSDISAQPPATPGSSFSPPTTSCVSLARVLPALGIALQHSDFRDASPRTSALLQHLVRGWVTVAAFISQQGLEAIELGDADPSAPQTDLVALLDNLDKVWSLLTDGNLTQALTTLPPAQLAQPDYRGSNRPRSYWPGFGATDVAGSRTLGPAPWWASADAVTIDPRQLDLGDDATVVMELDMDLAEGYRGRRLLVDSPWLSADVLAYGHTYYEQNYRRSNALYKTAQYANDWHSCHQYCVWDQPFGCQSWSFNPSAPVGQRCSLHLGYGDHVYAPGWKSNVISPESRPYVDFRDYKYVTQSRFLMPVVMETSTRPNWQSCWERCFEVDQCVSFTFSDAGTSCALHSSNRGDSPAACTGCTSASMPRYSLSLSHYAADRNRYTSSLQLKRSQVRSGLSRLAVVRTIDDHTYRAYWNGALLGAASFPATAMPWFASPSPFQVGRRDNYATEAYDLLATIGFEKVGHVAVWDGALDRGEILSMQSRGGNWAWRGPVTIPTGTAARNHDQRRPLAVTVLETLNKQVQLLEAYVRSKQGAVYGECVAGQSTALREQVQARVSRTLRGAVYAEDLAARMHDRGRQYQCDRDSECPATSQCGEHPRVRVTAAGAAMTGRMQTCQAWYMTDIETNGVCVPANPYGDPNLNGGLGEFGSSVPGEVGTATFTFNATTPGTYAVWGKVVAGNYRTGFWIRIDGGPWIQWDTLTQSYGWVWSQVPGMFDLGAGSHTITVGVRDDGTQLHELMVTPVVDRKPDALDSVCV
jgi:hypothetical protein